MSRDIERKIYPPVFSNDRSVDTDLVSDLSFFILNIYIYIRILGTIVGIEVMVRI